MQVPIGAPQIEPTYSKIGFPSRKCVTKSSCLGLKKSVVRIEARPVVPSELVEGQLIDTPIGHCCADFQSQLHQTQCDGFPIRPLKWFTSQKGNHDSTTSTKLEVAQCFRKSKERLGLDCGSRSVNIPTETAIQAAQRAMRIDANHDNEGCFAVSGCNYQRYRPAILRIGPTV